jgi:hypothetical protein
MISAGKFSRSSRYALISPDIGNIGHMQIPYSAARLFRRAKDAVALSIK